MLSPIHTGRNNRQGTIDNIPSDTNTNTKPMTSQTLCEMLHKKNALMYFLEGINRGITFRNDGSKKKNLRYLQKHLEQVKTITEEQWNTAISK